MTTYTAVLPYVYRPWLDECLATCDLDVYTVDNTIKNIGIMRSHNLGIDRMRADRTEWLIIMSAALRFGVPGGLDFIEQLGNMSGHRVVEAAGVYGWHLIAFHRDTIDRIGRWDPNYSPYGFDDLDMSLRYQLAYGNSGQLWEKVPVDVTDSGMGHGLKLGGVKAPAEHGIDYFKLKWGRHPGHSQESHYPWPFNNPSHEIGFWPEYEGDRWDK